jgi:hypothetical protein
VDHDVIGSEPDRTPRRRPAGQTVRLPDRLRRHRRTLVALAVVVAVIGVVTVLRAGITGLKPEQGPGAPVVGAQRKPPLAGSVITLVSGQNTLYALAADSAAASRPILLASENDGATWSTLTLPGMPSDQSAVAGWQLTVTGVEESLAIENGDGATISVGGADIPFVTRRIVPRQFWARVPAGREAMVRICPQPRCHTERLDYLEPRTGELGPLQVQPPVTPRALGVVGSQIWVAGVDPTTRRYAVAVSMDDAGSWATMSLPTASTDPKLVARVLPVPELNTAWLLLGKPGRGGALASTDLWVVPVPTPHVGGAPHQVRSEDPLDSVTGAVGLKDGRLVVIDRGVLTVLAQDGVADVAESSDVGSVGYVLRQPQRGPHLLVVALALRSDGVAAIATSLTGNANDWRIRPVVL